MGQQDLLALLDRAEKALGAHSLAGLSDSQSAHLRYTLVSVSAAETLANHKTLEGDGAFLSALFRQLGLLLVAWNYPTVFGRAQRAALEDEESPDERGLERRLSALLGFSPELLGASVLESFSVGEEIADAVGAAGHPQSKSGLTASRTTSELAELCRVGEALARANDPEHYPQSSKSWSEAKSTIQKVLGEDGLKRVQESFDTNSSSYRDLGTGILGEKTRIDPEKNIAQHEQSQTRDRNPYIEACPLHFRQRLREFYGWRTQEKNPQEAVAYLLREVIPVSGFEAGIVYTLDPSFSELVPRLKFGAPTLRKAISHKVSEDALSRDPVLSSLHVPAPCVSRVAGQDHSFAVGALGGSRKIGVMYVEFSSELAEQENIDVLVNFKALCQALLDALGIAG